MGLSSPSMGSRRRSWIRLQFTGSDHCSHAKGALSSRLAAAVAGGPRRGPCYSLVPPKEGKVTVVEKGSATGEDESIAREGRSAIGDAESAAEEVGEAMLWREGRRGVLPLCPPRDHRVRGGGVFRQWRAE